MSVTINNVKTLDLSDILILPYCTELRPLQGQQKSFYKKAFVYHNERENRLELRSYDTLVISYNYKIGKFTQHWHDWSATTAQHIKAFCGEYITKHNWMKGEL